MLVPHDGSSRFAAVVLKTMRAQDARRRPEIGLATVVDGRIQPDDWSGRPFPALAAEHGSLVDGDRVIVAWVGGEPRVIGRLQSSRQEWWPADQAQVTGLRDRVAALEQRLRVLETRDQQEV